MRRYQQHITKNILAIVIGILPANIIMIWYRLTHTEAFTTFEMLVYPLIFGSANILLILLLNKYLLKGKLVDFNRGKRMWYMDITAGIILTFIYFSLLYIEQATFKKVLPEGKPPSQEVINLMIDLAHNPFLLAVWLGPVVWIGVALFEELIRTFFLNCLWRISDRNAWQIFAIVLVSAVTAFVHLYQGVFGIVSVGIQSILMGFYYYKFRRIWPLIISHALFDSAQIIMFVMQIT